MRGDVRPLIPHRLGDCTLGAFSFQGSDLEEVYEAFHVDRLARRWGISKSKVLRRAVGAAAPNRPR